MTLQEIFDKVATHLLTQPRSINDVGDCLYRGPDGKKCAAGILIPDEEYNSMMEGTAFESVYVTYAMDFLDDDPKETDEKIRLVNILQSVHDRGSRKDNKPILDETVVYLDHANTIKELELVAEEFELNTTLLHTFEWHE